jgi:hypothetical protein
LKIPLVTAEVEGFRLYLITPKTTDLMGEKYFLGLQTMVVVIKHFCMLVHTCAKLGYWF